MNFLEFQSNQCYKIKIFKSLSGKEGGPCLTPASNFGEGVSGGSVKRAKIAYPGKV
jgi:hypothetical protein